MERARGLAFAVTNIIKLAGLALAVKQGLSNEPNSAAMALAAFMMAGAQVSEGALLALVDKFFAQPEPPREDGRR